MFSNGKWNKNVTTVGEVVAELSLLDPDLPVHSSFVESVDLVVFNRNQEDKHLEFCDGEEWDNEYEESLEA
jgi:hypothetical protein